MKKKVISIMMSFVMILSTVVYAYGSTTSGVSLYDTDYVYFSTSRTSRTTADIYIDVNFTQTVDNYSVVVYLQKKVGGEWVLDTTNDDYVYYNNGFNANSFTYSRKYNDLTSGVTYRIKCVSKDYINGVPTTSIFYSPSF